MKVFWIGILMIAMTHPAVAHHRVSATFDENKATTLHGVVTMVNWANPHVTLTRAVHEPNGAITTWQIGIAAPNALHRDGIRMEMISIMKNCDILIWPARDGSRVGAGRTITFESGKSLDIHDRFAIPAR